MALPSLFELRPGVSSSPTHCPRIIEKLSELFTHPTGGSQQMGDDDETSS